MMSIFIYTLVGETSTQWRTPTPWAQTWRMIRANQMTTPSSRVTTFELSFDLVFVPTITRLTGVLHHEPDLIGLLTVLLILANIWWMYSGYSWVTINTAPRR